MSLELVAGDDFTLIVPLVSDDDETVLHEGDEVRAVLSQGDQSFVFEGDAEDDTVTFMLTGDITEQLSGRTAHMCVHIYWADGGRATVKFDDSYELVVGIVRCHDGD